MAVGKVHIRWNIRHPITELPAVGSVRIRIPADLRATTDHIVYPANTGMWIPLVDGQGTIDIPDPHDPGVSPQGWTPVFDILSDVWDKSFPFVIGPGNAGQTVHIDTKAPAVTPPAVTEFALVSMLEGLATVDYVADYVAEHAGGGASTPDATSLIKGKIMLTGDLGGTAAAPTVPALAGLTNGLQLLADGLDDVEETVATKVDAALVDAAGDLLIGSGPDALARLGKGSNGQVLTVTGGAVGWTTPAGGGGGGAPVLDPVAVRYGCLAITMDPHDLSWKAPQVITLRDLRLYQYWIPLPVGTVVTGVRVPVSSAGSGGGALHWRVYQDDNSVLGTSGDVAAQFLGAVGSTWQNVPLTASAATTGPGVWITALSTMTTGPGVLFCNTDSVVGVPGWVLNPDSHRTALLLDVGAATPPTTLVPASGTPYLDFLVGVY